MPTQRRLINKKAYDELELLMARCDREESILESGLKIVNGKEMFYVNVMRNQTILKELVGKNYTEIEKNLTSYLLGL